jgi:hypothetical protein
MSSRHPKPATKFACSRPSCRITCTRKADLHRHEIEKHRAAKMMCGQAGCRYKGTVRQDRLNKHLRKEHSWLLHGKHRIYSSRCYGQSINLERVVTPSPVESSNTRTLDLHRSVTEDIVENAPLQYHLAEFRTTFVSTLPFRSVFYRESQFANIRTSNWAPNPYYPSSHHFSQPYGPQTAVCHYEPPSTFYPSLGQQLAFASSTNIMQPPVESVAPADILLSPIKSEPWQSDTEFHRYSFDFSVPSQSPTQSPEVLEEMPCIGCYQDRTSEW